MTRLLANYLKQYRLLLWLLLLFTAVFYAILSAYGLPAEAAVYSALLCLTAAAVIITVHFISFKKRYDILSRAAEDITFMNSQPFGTFENVSPTEEKYIEIIEKLTEKTSDMQSEMRRLQTDSEDFYTAWAHQIKTPIAVMKMTLEQYDTKQSRELLMQLFRIEQYTEMALYQSRLGGSDLSIEKTPLDGVIRASVRKYAPQFISKKIRLVYGGSESIAITDRKWLGFIIEQLLSNAVKYTEEGSVTVSAEGEKISIEDTGIGIPASDLPRIFEKGYTGQAGRMEGGSRSTGLGLYLAQKAADKLSHKLYAQSQQGKGSMFVIDLHTNDMMFE